MKNSIYTKLDNVINRLKIDSKRPNIDLSKLIEKELENLEDVSDCLLLKELSE